VQLCEVVGDLWELLGDEHVEHAQLNFDAVGTLQSQEMTAYGPQQQQDKNC
jgi:hypothetical protein